MKKLAALVLAFGLSPAIADTVNVSFSNISLTGASWGDLSGGIGVSSGDDTQIDRLYGSTGAAYVAAGGMIARRNAAGTQFIVNANETVPGTVYYGSVVLGSDHYGDRIAIAPGATVTLSALFDTIVDFTSPCDDPACTTDVYGSIGLNIGMTRDPYPGQVFEFLNDWESFGVLSDFSFVRTLQVSYTNTTGFWQFAAVDMHMSMEGAVAAIPEPGTYALLALGLGAIVLRNSRRST